MFNINDLEIKKTRGARVFHKYAICNDGCVIDIQCGSGFYGDQGSYEVYFPYGATEKDIELMTETCEFMDDFGDGSCTFAYVPQSAIDVIIERHKEIKAA